MLQLAELPRQLQQRSIAQQCLPSMKVVPMQERPADYSSKQLSTIFKKVAPGTSADARLVAQLASVQQHEHRAEIKTSVHHSVPNAPSAHA